MRLKVILGSALVIAILAVGCGGGGGDSSGGTDGGDGSGATTADSGGGPPLSKAKFIAKGDKICAKVPATYRKMLAALEKENKAKGNGKTSTAEGNLKAAVPPLYTAIEELEGLTPPSGDEKEVEAILTAFETAARAVEEKPSSELQGPKSPFAEFQELATEYGFKGCNQL